MKIGFFLMLLLPLGGIAYVGWHVWRILPWACGWKILVVTLMALCFSLLFVNFSAGLDRLPLPLARAVYAVGTSSLIILIYLVMLFLVLDIAQWLHLLPSSFLRGSGVGSAVVFGFMVLLFLYGNIHYHHKVRQPLTLTTSKPLSRPVKMVLLSDLHLGYHNGRSDLEKWVRLINAEEPDYVLIAGDLVDISHRPLTEERMAEVFRRIKAPVYAALGNHDYYAGEPRSEQFFRESGITLLKDSCVALPCGVTLIGRDDRTNDRRQPLEALVRKADPANFTILLDHQPYRLEEAQKQNIDFQFSGHTHYGQVWPVSWIERLMYEDAFGPLQKGNTHYYVTSGMGIWGGKFRIGTRSEYVVLTISGDQE